MIIGLVLNKEPGYSETFFVNKINSLMAAGHRVVLFVSSGRKAGSNLAQVRYAVNLSGSFLRRAVNSTIALACLIIKAPLTVWRFLKLEKQAGISFRISLLRLIINSHILSVKTDWLHFGFATLGVDREHVGKAIGAKVAVSLRGYDVSVYPLKHPGCYEMLWQNVAKVHTISDDLLKVAYDLGLPRRLPVTKITPAIDAIRFSNIKAGFFKEGQINILTVARLHWIKGMEYILEALALLQEDGFNFKYTIAGDGEDRERLVFAVHQLGLVDRVIFLGKVSHADIPSLMRDNDLYIQYSIQEGFCNSVLEAQAAGMLCIVSDAACLSENVIDDRTGWVVSKRRPDLLAKKIQEVINMPQDELLKVTRRATERIKSEFNLEKQREEFNAFYKELA